MKKYLLTCFALALALCSFAQGQTVTGTVTVKDDGSALPGVSVIVKGTTIGTVTSAEGTYSIAVPSGDASLVFSFIGLKTAEVFVGDRSVVDVSLLLDVTQLSEVVVTGTGVATDKKKLGIAVESISADKLPPIPTASIDQALIGKIAGAQISSTSGSPGAPVSILLRGINTLQGGTNPLIMMDGVEVNATQLGAIDLNNVEKVEVVQGAAAATIYGAQGANGVMQIFSKKGKEGPLRIDVSARVSFDTPLNVGNLHQPYNHSFATNANGEILDNAGGLLTQNEIGTWGELTWENGPSAKNNKPYKNNTVYHDHMDQLFRTAKTQNYSISISGATPKTDYSFAVSKNRQESVINGELIRNNFSLNIGTEIFKNFTFRFTNQFVISDNTVNPDGSAGISAGLYTYPFADFEYKDADGNHIYKFGGAGANATNPLYRFQYQRYNTKTLDIIPIVNFNYKINKFFTLDYKYTINNSRIDYERYTDNQSTNASSLAGPYFVGQSLKGDIQRANTNKISQNSLATATVHADLANDLGWSIPITTTTLVAFDWRKYTLDRTYSNYIGIPGYQPANGSQAFANNAGVVQDKFITYGFLVNEKLEYKNAVGISGGFRSDWASTYGQASRPFTFPRGDAYVRLSEFGMWDNLKGLFPELKLRAAYGEAGIQPVLYKTFNNDPYWNGGAYPDHTLRTPNLNPGAFEDAGYLALPPDKRNPDLKVERSSEFEYGIDISLTPGISESVLSFVNLNFTVWNRQGKDIIWPQSIAPSNGVVQYYTNYINLESNGIQFAVDAQLYDGKNFDWDLLTTFGHQISRVLSTLDGKDVPLPWSSAATYTLRPGEALGTIYGYKALTSIDQKDTEGNYYLDQSQASNYEIVDGRVVDKTAKTVQFTSDKYLLGNTTPKFNMAFTNSFHYKELINFSFQLDWIYGQKTYNQTKEWMYSEGLHGDFDIPLTINGEPGAWTAYYKSFYDASESNGTKDFFFENSSFLRLRNVSIGFNLEKVFKIERLNRFQLTFSGRNLWTHTKYSGFDPESNQNTSGGGTGSAASQVSAQRGLDYWSFPNFKSYQIGLTIGL